MELRILGPVEVWHAGRPLHLGPAKQRTLMAKLLQHPNQVVSAGHLIEAMWGETAPKTAPAILHTYVYRLRRALQSAVDGRTGEELLITQPPGYLLRVRKGQLDLERFESLVAAAARATVRGDHPTAARLLRSALSLWRGEPFANVAWEGLRRSETIRLEERRLEALEMRIDADLRLGRHGDLTGELAALVAEHPLRERLQGQLMVALYRSGRQAEALACYRQLRQMLVDELGLEPGTDLQKLQRAILVADPSLVPAEPVSLVSGSPPAAPASKAVMSPPTVQPRQLPPDTAWFSGREQELARLVRLLSQAEPGVPTVIVAINGLAGVGKSALATRAAHRLAARFPDGQLYVDLGGSAAGPAPLGPGEVLGRFLRAFGVDGRHLPGDPEERAGLLRSLLAERRVLTVLDNAATVAQVRLLLPAGFGCAALITSRRHLAELDGAIHLHLDVLGSDEAITLLARLAGVQRVTAEPSAAAEVVQLCGRLPLALRVAGARLAGRPAWSLSTLAGRLRDERRRLDELELDGLAVRASLQVAYREHCDRVHEGVDTARAFRLLGLLDSGDVGLPVAVALLDQPARATEASLEQLVDANLLESRAPGRYRFHDLVRLFACERASCDDPLRDRVAALGRSLRWYLAATGQADRLLRPGRPHVADEPLAAHVELRDRVEALNWLETEQANLVAAVKQAAASPDPEVAWQLAAALFGFFDLRGYWDEWEQVNRLALLAAQRCGDQRGEAQARRDLGAIAWRRFRLEEAANHLTCSLELRRLVGDRHGEAQTLNSLGLVLTARRGYEDAAAYLEHSRVLFRAYGDRRGEGQVLNNLGDLYRRQGRYDEALACLQGDLAICREVGDRRGEAITLCNLGEVQRDRHCAQEAFDHHHQSMAICQELGDRRGQGLNLDGLGEVRRLQGRYGEAIDLLRQGVALLRETRDRHAEAEALWHLGLALDADDRGEATSCLQRALTTFEQVGAPEAGDVRQLLRQRQPTNWPTEQRTEPSSHPR
jgi:DNA-binding SARP family transcriptional activator/tetratricopeptide (TPR) repeat protein